MATRMITDDGWSVEVINLSGRQVIRVTQHGTLVRPRTTVAYDPKAEFTTIEQVQAIMGESFRKLHAPVA